MKGNSKLYLIFFTALILRLLVSPYLTHSSDMGLWKYWADDIAKQGFYNYFEKTAWTDYLPSYFYILFILGKLSIILHNSSDFLFKIPGILADLGTGLLLYKILSQYKAKNSLVLTSLYLFNPAFFANSAMWGQVDSIGGFLMMLALFLFLNQKIIFLGLTIAAAILFKPLYLIAIPIFTISLLKLNRKKLPTLLLSILLFTFLITLPFAKSFMDVPNLIGSRYAASLNQYHYASVNAFNFWGAAGQNWISDDSQFLGITYHNWGLLIFADILFILLVNLFLNGINALPLTLTLAFLNIFMFSTRAHERHLYTALPFFILLLNKGSIFKISYLILSLIYLINLYFGIEYLYHGFLFDNMIVQIISSIAVFITLILTVSTIFSNENKLK